MKEDSHLGIKTEDAQEIRRRIIEDANNQAQDILAGADKEKTGLMEEAKAEAEARSKEILKNTDIEIEKTRQRVFSTLNLEKKRLFLEEKAGFIEEILENVKGLASDFRQKQEYREFLEKSILEGVRILGEKEVDIFYSSQDEKILKDDFIKGIKTASRDILGRDVDITFKKSEFKDIGVIAQSKDARLIYDNRFLSRFKRVYEEIYMDLLKGAF